MSHGSFNQEATKIAESTLQLRLVLLGEAGLPTWLEPLLAKARPAVALPQATDLKTALASNGEARVLVMMDAPRRALHNALAKGSAPAEALAVWVAQTGDLVTLCRQNRRRVLICDRGAIDDAPAEFVTALGARLQVTLPTLGGLPAAASSGASGATESLLDMLAASLLATEPRAMALLDELEAMTIGPVSRLVIGRDAALKVAEAQLAILGAGTDGPLLDLSILADEVSLLREALRLAHAEIERAKAAGEAQAILAEAAGEATQRQFDQQEALRLQREDVLGAMLLERDRMLGETEAQMGAIYASRSWRLTRPVRAITRRIPGRG